MDDEISDEGRKSETNRSKRSGKRLVR
jgi:hypothetical protein